jgi:peptidoglycan/LPS O-acetylase OafA/YrhL
MLQRSQSLFLLGVFILSVLLLTGPLAKFFTEGGELILKHSGVVDSEGLKLDLATWPLTTIFALVSALSFLNIFFYRNRIRQIRIAIFTIFLCAGMTGMMFYYSWVVSNTMHSSHTIYLWRFMLPPVCIILLYLAFRRIRRDELLVKAYERIR